MGVTGEKGVYRELMRNDAANEADELGTSYRVTYEREDANAGSLAKRMDRFKPDVVYVWNQQALSKSLLFDLQTQGVPLFYDLSTNWLNEYTFESDPWFRWWKRNKSKRSSLYRVFLTLIGASRRLPVGHPEELDLSHASVCSASLRDDLIAGGLAHAASLPVVPPAVDTSRLVVKREFQPVRRFMWAGRLTAGKAPALALDAVRILKERGIDVSLDYYGVGEPLERKGIRDLIDHAGLGDRVRMHGIRPGELLTQYQDYDALLFTSCCRDPFPITPLEALLSGLPAILAKDGGIVEVVEDGETALLFEAGDSHALADAMVRMMRLPDGGEAMSRKCLERLKPRHCLDMVIDQVEAQLSAAAGE
jgi:glycosyltransferase involved in cell wall biosynthesis